MPVSDLILTLIDYFKGNLIGHLYTKKGENLISLQKCGNQSVEMLHNCFPTMFNSTLHLSIWKFIITWQNKGCKKNNILCTEIEIWTIKKKLQTLKY